MRHGVWLLSALMIALACGPNPPIGGGCAGAGATAPECGSAPGKLLVSVERGNIRYTLEPQVRRAEIRVGDAGAPGILTGEASALCEIQPVQCESGVRTQSVGAITLTSEDMRSLNSLLAALPARGCSPYPKLNPNCDDFYPTVLQANGTSYIDHDCALEPCWTPDMAAVIGFIDGVVARTF